MGRKETTEITCFFGDTEKNTWIGEMIEAGYQEEKLRYRHIPVDVKEHTLEQTMGAVRLFGIKGVALDGEYEREVLPFLDTISLSAEISGQVSAVCNRDGRLLGENMEGKGLITALMNAGIFLQGKTVVIVGGGNREKAAAAECALAGAGKIYFLHREARADEALAKHIAMHSSAETEYRSWKERIEIPEGTDVIIFAQDGESGDNGILPEIYFAGSWRQITVCDMASRPRESQWMKAARENGATVIDDREILVNQAALNYSFWTEHIAPIPIFYDILKEKWRGEKSEQVQKSRAGSRREEMDAADQKLIEKMVEYYAGDPKRIQHFLKVYAFACLIGKAEKLDTDTFFILKTAAIVHDIGIRISEEKYGTSSGKYQEKEGPAVAEPLLRDLGYNEEVIDRVLFLIANHHTYGRIEGADYQILVEADFLVNLYEDNCSRKTVEHVNQNIFRTTAGRWYLEQMFLCGAGNDSMHPFI